MEVTDFVSDYVTNAFPKDYPYGSQSSGQSSKGLSTKFVHNTKDFPPGFGPNSGSGRTQREKGFMSLSDFYWRRSVGAVKTKCDQIKVKKDPNNEIGSCDDGERVKVQRVLTLFRERCNELSKNENGVVFRVDIRAMKELIKEGIISKRIPSLIGPVPGVEVGIRFRYRVEMMIVGLHKQLERGIDHKVQGGKTLATSVVATEGHSDMMHDANILIYVGEGRLKKPGLPYDQQLSGGNLALWRSMEEKSVVRVVRGFKNDIFDRYRKRVIKMNEYVYDGLYEVISCEKKRGLAGNLFFEFKMSRCPGQPRVALKGIKRSRF